MRALTQSEHVQSFDQLGGRELGVDVARVVDLLRVDPVLIDAAMEANITIEGASTAPFLRNVTGLWALLTTMRAWGECGRPGA